MFGSTILDVAAGIVLVYFVLSLICTTLVEWVARFMSLRADTLEMGIRKLLDDPAGEVIADRFYEHALIKGITQDGRKPSYIPSRFFTLALMDLLFPAGPARGPRTLQEMRDAVQALPPAYAGVKQSVGVLLEEAGDDLQKFRSSLEQWFDEVMDRVSGWYRKKAQVIAFICACVVTVAANADTVVIARALYQDETLRKSAAAVAQEISVATKEASDASKQAEELTAKLLAVRLPLGWERCPQLLPSTAEGWWHRLMRLWGLVVTAIALSLGAPFWFQILNKIVNLRSAGTPIAGFDEKNKQQQSQVK